MKRITAVLLVLNIVVLCAFPGPNYLGIEFLKPNLDVITVGAKNLSFGNPANDGAETLPPLSFTIDYEIQAPGTLFVFFSAKNDLGFDGKTGDFTNPFMLSSHRDGGGVNYGVSVTTDLPIEKNPDPYVPSPYIDSPIEPIVTPQGTTDPNVIYLDMGAKGAVHKRSVINSGVVIRHTFTENEITSAIDGGASGLIGQDIITLTMDINNSSFRKLDGKPLPSGLYHGYIIVHYSVL